MRQELSIFVKNLDQTAAICIIHRKPNFHIVLEKKKGTDGIDEVKRGEMKGIL